jgi:hypothetical protein
MFLPGNETAIAANELFHNLNEHEPTLRPYDEYRGELDTTTITTLRQLTQPDPLRPG